jgi:sugar phosphate isomerase/epimerase
MRLSLCNEVLRDLPLERQCAVAASLGYAGLEIAPFTLAEDPSTLTEAKARETRRVVEDHGLRVTGLHWLLVAPEGLSITTDDADRRARTVDFLAHLVDLCAALGGDVLVHGSPKQRLVEDAGTPDKAWANAADCLAKAGEAAGKAGVTYCLEPLAARETAYVNTVEQALKVVGQIGQPALKTMVDVAAASYSETQPVAEVIRQFWPTGQLAHIQFNDANRRAPGQGETRFAPILDALAEVGFDGIPAVEPFVYDPDGPTTAAVAAGYLRGVAEGVER